MGASHARLTPVSGLALTTTLPHQILQGRAGTMSPWGPLAGAQADTLHQGGARLVVAPLAVCRPVQASILAVCHRADCV